MKYAKFKNIWANLAFLIIFAQPLIAQPQIKELITKTSPAVVTVLSYDSENNLLGFGSGFVVKSNGYVITNYHVIKEAEKIAIKMKNGDIYWAEGAIEFDPSRDFVILKISSFDIPFVPLGNSNNLEIGDKVIAIGNPQGLEHSVSDGLISQKRDLSGYSVFQITAPISQGSSGGPLLNSNGEVIGITMASSGEGQNLNFALPINYVRGVLESNCSVKYTISQIKEWQKEQDASAIAEWLNSNFVYYQEPNLFKMLCPRDWVHVSDNGKDSELPGNYITVMLAPHDAYQAELDGYLSEGIRITFHAAPENKHWKSDAFSRWSNRFVSNMLKINKGFALTDSSEITFCEQEAKLYSIVGEAKDMPEPEKTHFILLGNKRHLISIELVSPTSKLEFYHKLYSVLVETFQLIE